MRVTICQLPNDRDAFARAWSALVEHVQTASSELVVLPEMPFSTWLAAAKDVAQDRWNAAVRAHDEAIDTHLPALAPATVVASRPVVDAGVNLNRGFIWTRDGGVVDAHDKYYLPDEPGFYETDWYSRGDGTFAPRPAAGTTLGFQICSEMWFFERGRHYGQQGARVIVSPRATGASSVERWITGGRALAMTSGCFVFSSNHSGPCAADADLGGGSFAVDPDGEVLARTTASTPFATVDIDLSAADEARATYPRYIAE